MLGFVAWTALGLAGLALARVRGERARFRRNLLALVAVSVGYMGVLAGVSAAQAGPTYLPGQERCFSKVCFAVVETEELQGFQVRGEERERLLRVHVRVTNRSRDSTERESGLRVCLLDAQGRRWLPVAGLGGVPLTSAVPAGGSIVGEPVFRMAKDATGLRLILLHEQWTFARLTIGDPESLFHKSATMPLPREKR